MYPDRRAGDLPPHLPGGDAGQRQHGGGGLWRQAEDAGVHELPDQPVDSLGDGLFLRVGQVGALGSRRSISTSRTLLASRYIWAMMGFRRTLLSHWMNAVTSLVENPLAFLQGGGAVVLVFGDDAAEIVDVVEIDDLPGGRPRDRRCGARPGQRCRSACFAAAFVFRACAAR